MKKVTIQVLLDFQEMYKKKYCLLNSIEILLNAINDWPNPIHDLDEFELEINKVIGLNVNESGLRNFISRIDLSRNAWQGESLVQLSEIFEFYDKESTIQKILSDIKLQLEKQILNDKD